MSYQYVDGRGGAREGAGRPKLEEEKKAFRITEKEREFIKQMRRIDEDGLALMDKHLTNVYKKHYFNKYWG